MIARFGKVTLATVALAAVGFVAMPVGAFAQDSPEQGAGTISNKPVNLDLESADLYYGLKLLFQQIKANFTLDNSLKGIPVTVHLKDTPFRVALETLLKNSASGSTLTYRFENGIYSIVPKTIDDPGVSEGTGDTAPPEEKLRFVKIPGSSFVFNAINIIEALGGRTIRAWSEFGGGGGGGGFGGGGLGGGGMGGFGGGGMGGGGFGGGGGGFGGGGGGGFGGGGGGFGGGGGGFGGGGGGGRGF